MTTSFSISRTVNIAAPRLPGWLERFERRHGALQTSIEGATMSVAADDGAHAAITHPWEPTPLATLDDFVEHATRERAFALLLVRKGASGVGVSIGGQLVAHRVNRHYVQGRTKAGGWSQQRFARRRDNQATAAYRKASEDVYEVVMPHIAEVSWLVIGGDVTGVDQVLEDRRLARLAAMRRPVVLDCPEPRFEVLKAAQAQAYELRIDLDEAAIS